MRLLWITNVFPTPISPTRGVFNLELAKALSHVCDMRMVVPVAWTDEWAATRCGRFMPPDRMAAFGRVKAYYPRYYFPPKVFRSAYGRFMWHSVQNVVKEQIAGWAPEAVLGYWVHPDGEVAVNAACVARVPSAVMVGGSDVLLLTRGWRRRAKILEVLHRADVVLPVSHDLKSRLIDFGIPAAKVHVVGRGVDLTRFTPGDRREARRRLGLSEGGKMMLWVGRMVPVKGLDVLFKSCAALRANGPSFRLYLVGEGPLRRTLETQAAALGLGGIVTFVGAVSHADLGDWYRAADLTVLPSRSEGVPNVLRETLACGTPFVASKVGGIPEVAVDGQCRLVPADDPQALAGALAETLLDCNRAGTRQGALGPVANWEDAAEALVGVLRPLMNGPMPRPKLDATMGTRA